MIRMDFKTLKRMLPLCFLILFFIVQGCQKRTENATISILDTNEKTLYTKQTAAVPISYTKENHSNIIDKDKKQELTLLAVGDNLIHIQVIESGRKEDGTYNFDHLYSILKTEIEAADLSIINQETILGGDQFPYTGYPAFNSPTEIGDAIVNAGFDVVLHASNHTLDKGYLGVANTFEYWSQHPNITVLGINKSEEDQNTIPIIEKNGIKVAMLNYTYGLNGYSLPKDKPFLVNLLDKPKMKEVIKKAREQADFVVVFPHWGTEYKYEPDKNQLELAEFFAEEGVDLVIGTHPHVLEPVEWIETDSGHRMLIYYSLGNYVSYQKEAPRMLGGMAKITIKKEKNVTYISKASITPIVTHYEDTPDYSYGVYKLSDYTVDKAIRHGVLQLQQNSSFTLAGTKNLANQILGDWNTCYVYTEPVKINHSMDLQ